METFFQVLTLFFALLVLISIAGTYEEVKKLRKQNEETQNILKEINTRLNNK